MTRPMPLAFSEAEYARRLRENLFNALGREDEAVLRAITFLLCWAATGALAQEMTKTVWP